MKSITNKFILFVNTILLIGLLTTLGVQMFAISRGVKTSADNLHDDMEKLIYKVSENQMHGIVGAIDSELDLLEHFINVLSNDKNIIAISSSESNGSITDTINNFKESHDTIIGVYLGTEYGRFILDSSSNIPNQNYDHKSKDWYIGAKNNPGKPYWTEPYIDEGSQNLILTVSKVVLGEDNTVLGVVGIDLNMNKISDISSSYTMGNSGNMSLVHTNGTIVGHVDSNQLGKVIEIPEIIDALTHASPGSAEIVSFKSDTLNQEISSLAVVKELPRGNLVLIGELSEKDLLDVVNPLRAELNRMGEKLASTVLIAILLILTFSALITYSLSKKLLSPILRSIDATEKLAKGEFDFQLDISGKDELSKLSSSINTLKETLMNIAFNLKSTTEIMENGVEKLTSQSEVSAEVSQSIAFAVDEITRGAISQAEEVERTLSKSEDLSKEIEYVVESSYKLNEFVEIVKSSAQDGNIKIDQLSRQNQITESSLDRINESISNLSKTLEEVKNFTDIIKGIASQTNLLALNASIEAARAGESGRGFSVVAEEIRKLADGTVSANENVQSQIEHIMLEMESVLLSAKGINENISSQSILTNEVKDSFSALDLNIEKAINDIQKIGKSAKSMDMSKEEVMDAVKSVASISEETAASAEEISASTQEQSSSASELAQRATELKKINEELLKISTQFKI